MTLIVSQLFIQQSSVNEVVLVAAKSETKEKVKAIYRHLHPGEGGRKTMVCIIKSRMFSDKHC